MNTSLKASRIIEDDDEVVDTGPKMPPWNECNFTEKCYYILIKFCIYTPVVLLWSLCISGYVIYIIFYTIPNIIYTTSNPEIYY